MLSELIWQDSTLREAWKRLSDPWDALVAPVEDGTVRGYREVLAATLGETGPFESALSAKWESVRRELEERVPVPRINDQVLSPLEFSDFHQQIRGFRLLPPRQLPCSVVFQETTDPKIRGRALPSGLDFFVNSPVLRSSAAVRAVQTQFGPDIGGQLLGVPAVPLPDSLHGESMKLLAKLQNPLPTTVPAALRTKAWSDLRMNGVEHWRS